jgi:ribonuclease VapC
VSKGVMDASAILAIIGKEPGAEIASQYVAGGLVSSVNLAEVFSKSRDMKIPLDALRWMVQGLGLQSIPADDEIAFVVGSLREPTRAEGISLGDRYCLALGMIRRLPVITTEEQWSKAGLDVEIVKIR